MSANVPGRNPDQRQPGRKIRDLPGCIKYIILLFLLLLLFAEIYAGEFRRFPELSQTIWLVLFFKLFLILLIIILIWVQRQLTCEITSPKNCTEDEYDADGNPFIIVKGSVGGAVFGHYIIEVLDSTTSIIPGVVSYPGGGASGTSTVSNGELGRIDTSEFDPGMHTIRLRVFSSSGSEKSPPCQNDFDYQRYTIFVRAVGNIPITDTGAYSGDPGHKIKLITDGAGERSEGGLTNVLGGAYLHGCGKRTINYKLQYQPATPAAEPPLLTAAAGWTDVQPPLPFGGPSFPYWWNCFVFHIPNFVTNAELTRVWSASQCGLVSKPQTAASNWATHAGAGLNGRYTVRLVEAHAPIGSSSPVEEVIDGATVWLDNRDIVCEIRKMRITLATTSLDVCEEISLAQFLATGNADIIGQAWDPLIINGLTTQPSENFGSYVLTLKKDGGPSIPVPDPPLTDDWVGIRTSTTPIPPVRQVAVPAPNDTTDILAVWAIVAALDAGPLPAGAPPDERAPYPKLYRGQRCAYIIRLDVTDTTSVHNGGTTHNKRDDFPFCIMNDIPNDAPFEEPG